MALLARLRDDRGGGEMGVAWAREEGQPRRVVVTPEEADRRVGGLEGLVRAPEGPDGPPRAA